MASRFVQWLIDSLASAFNRLFGFNSVVEDDGPYPLTQARNSSQEVPNSPHDSPPADSPTPSSHSRRSQRLSITVTPSPQPSSLNDVESPPPTAIFAALEENRNHIVQTAMKQNAVVAAVNYTHHLRIPAIRLHQSESKPRARGASGDVWFGYLDESDGPRPVAIKWIRPRSEDGVASYDLLKDLLEEVVPWHQLNHRNISRFIGFTFDNEQATLVSEWQHYGNIMDYLGDRPDANRLELIAQAAEGLAYLHERSSPLIHEDIKLENILVSQEGIIKLTDFGISTFSSQHPRTAHPFRGTLRYADPVLLEGNSKPTTFTDLWAFAWVIFGILTERRPYDHIQGEGKVHLAIMKREVPGRSDFPNLPHGDIIWPILEASWSPLNSQRLPASCIVDRIRQASYPSASPLTPQSECGSK